MWLGLVDEAVMVATWLPSFAGPGLIPRRLTICVPESSRIVRFVRVTRVGGLFTGETVIVKELVTESIPPFAVRPLSLTTTVISAVPDFVATGVKTSVP